MEKKSYPLKHLSIRVPWHDNGWKGTVCHNPRKNTACLKLKRISESKDDVQEESVAGQSIEDLSPSEWPCCIGERGMFMAPFEYTKRVNHPYVNSSKNTHGHMKETTLRFPVYSAAAIPFRWMLKESRTELTKSYPIVIDEEREPKLSFTSIWWQEKHNQQQILNNFMNHIKDESLVFFYAKQVPHVEDNRRILIGVGRINHIGDLTEYEYKSDGMKSMLWERMIQHSIRPDFVDGFILPYQEIFDYVEENPEYDISNMIAFAPSDKMVEFSYATEHVSHDGAIESLISIANALQEIKKKFDGPWESCLQWIDNRLSEAWQLRGPYPGLGSALTAFGVGLGSFVAKTLEEQLEEEQDVWELVEEMFQKPEKLLPPYLARHIGKSLFQVWNTLPNTRKKLLKLVSRFEFSNEHAKLAFIKAEREQENVKLTDEEILENPYVLYEKTRLLVDPISVFTIDKGVYPTESILQDYPYLHGFSMDSPLDEKRIRAFSVYFLEASTEEGHTLLPYTSVIHKIRECALTPACEVHEDIMLGVENFFSKVIDIVEMSDGTKAYQLSRIAEMSQLIRDRISARISQKAKRHVINVDWRVKIDSIFKDISILVNEERKKEEKARTEKAAILQELAESRFSVLIGPAGTGKTTLLSILIDQEEIKKGEVLLLAPTGKARVRMEQVTSGSHIKAYTVAQFLGKTKRYDFKNYRYQLKHEPGERCPETVIVDEASMLTEEMMAALLESLKGVKRLIFVGDPKQLPPIGPGRPFVDIVSKLKPTNVDSIFPKVGQGYGQLTVTRRQNEEEVQEREDLRLAQWFSGNESNVDDDFFDTSISFTDSETLQFYQWENEEDLPGLLKEVLVKELELDSTQDEKKFEKTLGGMENDKGYINFYSDTRNKDSKTSQSAVKQVEDWQILTPVKNSLYGVKSINREIHHSFKKGRIEQAQKTFNRFFPKPRGSEQVVYGDKVINTRNHKRNYVWPSEAASKYIANGEIGLVIGEFSRNASHFNVEFSSQLGSRYEFFSSDFSEEGEPTLELAYALTVHKAQGSEFGKVFVIIPENCPLISPEMLYTALTRQKEKVIILHQGLRSSLLKYSSAQYSETARRYTNLFEKPQMIQFEGTFLEQRLIHRTTRGDLVRSKSEVIIADILHSHGIEYEYEIPLVKGNSTKYPDFTIEDDDTGNTLFWEHCGMMFDEGYKRRWERNLQWYRDQGIKPIDEGGELIITQDNENGGIDAAKIKEIISNLFD
ncbi:MULTISPECIES: AAA family ATPase [Bacillaceae]|uniref:AAA family ATPase n=1 Tax=Evansella alkalicola TaxID=745819 RepID=A0ABS6JYG0_9BACI|nr:MULTISPECIES: AAA family ATPase [Bacillaceae]MBU9723641.1 AAA family ATPase [Bacillus alkalicola]